MPELAAALVVKAGLFLTLSAAAVVLAGTTLVPAAVAQDGAWFSPEQVERGSGLYDRRCATCHGREKADNFKTWDDSAASLIDMIIGFGMPADRPGGLPAQEYVDIVGYVFNLGGLDTGEEVLAGDPALAEIRIK